MPKYVVIENTPGYLPEDDDPFTTDDISEARREMREAVMHYAESQKEIGLKVTVVWTGDSALVDTDAPNFAHSLGRSFEIMVNQDG